MVSDAVTVPVRMNANTGSCNLFCRRGRPAFSQRSLGYLNLRRDDRQLSFGWAFAGVIDDLTRPHSGAKIKNFGFPERYDRNANAECPVPICPSLLCRFPEVRDIITTTEGNQPCLLWRERHPSSYHSPASPGHDRFAAEMQQVCPHLG
jgi:hypothetical protein